MLSTFETQILDTYPEAIKALVRLMREGPPEIQAGAASVLMQQALRLERLGLLPGNEQNGR